MRDSVSNFFGGTDEQIYAEAAGDALPNLYGLATSLGFRDRHDHAQIDIRVFCGGAVSIGTEENNFQGGKFSGYVVAGRLNVFWVNHACQSMYKKKRAWD